MIKMYLEKHIQDVVNRSTAFYQKNESGHFLVNAKIADKVLFV